MTFCNFSKYQIFMDSLSPFHHLNPYSHQNPKKIHRLPKTLSPFSISLPIPGTHFSPSPIQFSPHKNSPFFHPFDEFNELRTFSSVKEMHAQMVKNPKNVNFITVDGTMTRNYLEFGDFVSAIKVFFVGFARNYLLWNSFMEEFESFGGDPFEILVVFNELHSKGVEFDSKAFTFVLKICLALRELCVGLEIHACLIKKGFHDDIHLYCALINFYEKCWSIDKANQVFHETPYQEDFLWNTIVMANLRSEKWKNAFELFGNMQRVSAKATHGIIIKMLQACGKLRALNEGKQLHGYSLRLGLVSDATVCHTLMDMYVLHGSFEMVLTSFRSLCNAGCEPDSFLVTRALKAIIELGFFKLGKEIHGYIMRSNLNCNAYVCTRLVDMYVKNDCLEKAHAVVRHAKNVNVYTWNSLISGYSFKGLFGDTEKLLNQMEEEGVKPDLAIWNCLVSGYSMRGRIEEALAVMNRMKSSGIKPDIITWNSVLSGYVLQGSFEMVLTSFRSLCNAGCAPDSISVNSALKAIIELGFFKLGKEIHGYIMKSNLNCDVYACTTLVNMYVKNDCLEKAHAVFRLAKNKNVSTWNSLISGYSFKGLFGDTKKLLNQMEEEGVKPNLVTWSCLVSGYSTRGRIEEALAVMNRMKSSGIKPNIITWNSVLSGYVIQGSFEMVLTSFRSMCNAGCEPDSILVNTALKAIIKLGFFKLGKEIHGYIMRSNLNCDVHVCTRLVNMYVKNDCLEKAHAVFRHAKNKNLSAWNSLISGYSFKGLFGDTKKLLNQMEEEGLKPDLVTWNCLVSGYSMRGRIEEALAVINRIKSSGITPNVVSWTALISGCSENGKYTDALQVFSQMQAENVKPDSTTICSLLRACAGPSLLKKGEEIHCFSMKLGIVDDIYLATALIDMYSKAGKLKVAHNVFSKTQEKTLACWNCMMMGYAIHGHGEEVMILYDKMREKRIRPDAITFTALLSGCKNSGLVEEGWRYFDSMHEDYNIIPTIEHYCCMVDLLGKAGFLDEALDLIKTMPIKPDASIWGALLASCRIHKNIKLAEIAAEKLFKMEPNNSANYVLMMNLYSSLNQWNDVERLKRSMITLGMKSPPVWSWTQVNQGIHVFSTDGKPHPEEGEIYFELYRLISEIQNLGYVADLKCVCQNIDDNEKEKILLSHTEKLAMVFGVMKMKGGSPIRVVKNTRICCDCHTVAKYISLARNCEILLRDAGRFHHFKDGKCSCNDCW